MTYLILFLSLFLGLELFQRIFYVLEIMILLDQIELFSVWKNSCFFCRYYHTPHVPSQNHKGSTYYCRWKGSRSADKMSSCFNLYWWTIELMNGCQKEKEKKKKTEKKIRTAWRRSCSLGFVRLSVLEFCSFP